MNSPAVAEDIFPNSSTWVLPFTSVSDIEGHWHTPADVLEICPQLHRLFRYPCVWSFHQGDEMSLTPPHEWVKAWQLGWLDVMPARFPAATEALAPGLVDGALPWAAHEMQHLLASPQTPAAWFVPCHQEVGMDHIRLHPPASLALSESHSKALMQALEPWAAEDGITLQWISPTRWLAVGEPLNGLRCPSLDRVIGRSIAPWLAAARISPNLRRLQSEAQMLFYTHPAHDERVNEGALPVNSFWIEGNGVLPPLTVGTRFQQTAWTLVETLRPSAQQGDMQAWQQAWVKIDASLGLHWLQRLESGLSVCLWLVGERGLLTLTFHPMSRWQRLRHGLQTLFNSQRSLFNLTAL